MLTSCYNRTLISLSQLQSTSDPSGGGLKDSSDHWLDEGHSVTVSGDTLACWTCQVWSDRWVLMPQKTGLVHILITRFYDQPHIHM